MKLCRSCHHENQEEAVFCENCGEKFEQESIQSETLGEAKGAKTTCSCGAQLEADDKFCPACGKAVANESSDQAQTVAKTPMSKKQKLILGLVAVLLCIAFGSYFATKNYYSQENQLKRMVETVQNKDVNQMEKLTFSADPNYTVTKKELKKYFDYYSQNEHKAAFSQLITQLKTKDNQNSELVFVKKGKKLLLFDDFRWELKPRYITITANQKDMKLFLDDQEKETTDKNQFQTVWGPLTPAEYWIKGELAGEKSETTIDLVQSSDSDLQQMSQVSLDFKKISFKLKSNILDAEVFLDDQKVGQLAAEEYEVKNQIWHQGMAVQLKKTLDDKSIIETKQQVITDSSFAADNYDPESYSSMIELNFADIQGKSEVDYFLNGFYAAVSSYTGTYTTYDAINKQKFSTYFTDGENNAEYQDFNTFIQSIRDSKVKSAVNGSPTVETVKMNGKNSYVVRYLIKYETRYQDYKTKDITQIFRYQKATLIYDEEAKKFTIQSLGGKENFEIVDNGGIE